MNLVRALRVLIVLEIGLFLLYSVSDSLLESALPAPLQLFILEKENTPLSLADILSFAIAVLLFVVLATAWIGLWRLKPWGRSVYTAATGLGIVAIPAFAPFVTHGIAEMFSEAGSIANGMTLALIWFSPLATHFQARR